MIRTLLRQQWLVLKRDRMALLLVFAVPIAFFSVFGWIYLEMAGVHGLPIVKVAVLDLDGSSLTGELLSRLGGHSMLRMTTLRATSPGGARDEAIDLLRSGKVGAVVVVPEGFAARLASPASNGVVIEVLEDRSDPLAGMILASVLENFLAKAALEGADLASGGIPPAPHIVVERKDIFGTAPGYSKRAAVAFSAAGTGVLFLLFAMAGAGGTLLDEEQEGTLERLLNADVGIGTILLSKWGFASAAHVPLGMGSVRPRSLRGWPSCWLRGDDRRHGRRRSRPRDRPRIRLSESAPVHGHLYDSNPRDVSARRQYVSTLSYARALT